MKKAQKQNFEPMEKCQKFKIDVNIKKNST